MTRYFKKEDSEFITVVEKELEKLVSVYGLEVLNEDNEWESVNQEGYAHFDENDEFVGVISICLGSQVNSSNWVDLDEDSKYRFEYDEEELNRDAVIDVLKSFDQDEVRIEWNGSNHEIFFFVVANGYNQYEELELNIDTSDSLACYDVKFGTKYLYQDEETKKFYIGSTSQYQGNIFEELEEWEIEGTIEEVKEEFINPTQEEC